jgi:hypothetical protein
MLRKYLKNLDGIVEQAVRRASSSDGNIREKTVDEGGLDPWSSSMSVSEVRSC